MKKILFITITFFSVASWSQLSVSNTTQTVAQNVQNNLVGAGVTPFNITFNGSAANALLVRDQVGRFLTNFNATNLGLDTGMIMSTGNAQVALGPNTVANRSQLTATPTSGDADLALLSGQSIQNVSIIEFDFVATGPTLKFDYVFASEEYPEFVNSINDTFGFFLRGPGITGPFSGGAANIAVVPLTTTPISINTVNNGLNNNGTCANCTYYYNNTAIGNNPTIWNPAFSTQYDGFTKNLSANATLVCGQTYHIKLAIANAVDNLWDSAVFLKNFSIPPMVLVDGSGADTIVSCEASYVVSSGIPAAGNTFVWTLNGVVITTATTPNLTVNANGLYELSVFNSTGCLIAKDDITVNFAVVASRDPQNLIICATGASPYTYNINQNVYMLNGAAVGDYVFVYHVGSATGPIIPFASLAAYSSAGAGEQIWVNVEDINTNGCSKDVFFTLTTTTAPSGTFGYSSPSFCETTTVVQNVVPVALSTGGVYTATPAGLTINSATGAITPSTSTPNTYTINYNIPVSATCPVYNTTASVTIAPVFTPTINCGTTTTNSVTFTWAAVTGATGYSVSYQVGASPVVNIGAIGNVLTYTVTPLSPGDNVTITLTPTGAVGACFLPNTQSCIATNCAPPTATISYASPFCTSDAVPKTVTLTGTGLFTGGTYSAVPATLTINTTTGDITPSSSAADTYVVTYTIPSAAVGCSPVTATTNVVINGQPNAGADGATTACDSSTTTIGLATIITGQQPGGVWTQSTGTGGSFNAVAGTFTPAIGCTTSTFTYTLTGTAPCVNDSSLATITINAAPTASIAGTVSICPNTGTNITFTGTPNGTVTYTINAGANQTIVLNGLGTAVLPSGNLTVNTTYALVSAENTVTTCSQPQLGTAVVSLTALPSIGLTSAAGTDAQALCANTTMTNIQYAIGGTATGASISAGPLPAGVTGTYAAGVFTISGIPSAVGTFNYTVTTAGGCAPNVSLSGSITVNPLSTIALTSGNATPTLCANTALTPIVYTAGVGVTNMTVGVLPAGVTGTYVVATNTFTIAGTPTATATGLFNYTVTTAGGCLPNVSLSGTITVTALPSMTLTSGATTNAQTLCANTPLTNIQYTIGGTATSASITAGALPTGVIGTFAGTTFTISGTPNVPLGGTFNYTVTTTGGCAPNVSLSGSITVNPLSTIALTSGNATPTLCANTALTAIVYTAGAGVTNMSVLPGSLPAGVTGVYALATNTFTISGTPSTTATGTFNYTVTTTGGCLPNATLSGVITVNVVSAITLTSAVGSNVQTLCAGTLLSSITYGAGSGVTGASITAGALPTGVTGNFTAGVFTISGTPTLPAGTTASVTYNYTVTTSGGCAPNVSLSGTIIVNPLSSIVLTSVAATTAQTICANVAIAPIVYATGFGVTGVNVSGVVVAPVIAGLPAGITGTFVAGVFTISGAASVLPLVNTTYAYTLTTVGGCAPNAVVNGTITVTPAPTITLTSAIGTDNTQTICNGTGITSIVYAIGGSATGATVTGLPAGITGSFVAGISPLPNTFTLSGTANVSASQVYTYTVTTMGGCAVGVGATASGTITVTAKPVPILTSGSICLDLAGNPNGTYTLETQLDDVNYEFIWNNTTTGTPVLIAGQTDSFYVATAPGTYTVQAVPNLNTSCLSDVVSVVVTPGLPPASAVTVTSDYFAALKTVTVSVTPVGVYEYQIDNGAFQSSNVFQGVSSGPHNIVARNACGVVVATSYIVTFPQYFTPNGDGANDTWNISELSTQPNAKIYIFDRFGKLLKEIQPSGDGWNGFFNNQELPATDYWFTLSYEENNIKKELKSHFALKR